MKRCGVAPGEPTVALARAVDASPHLRFSGLMAWEGHTVSMAEHEIRRDEIVKAIGRLTGAADAVRAAGLPVDIVSCGGSGTYLHAAPQPGITEVQAGGATMGDGFYRALESPVEPALTLLTTVTSRPAEDRIVIDAGRRAIDPSQKAADRPRRRGRAGDQVLGRARRHGTRRTERNGRASATASSWRSITPTRRCISTNRSSASVTASSPPSGRWPAGAGCSKTAAVIVCGGAGRWRCHQTFLGLGSSLPVEMLTCAQHRGCFGEELTYRSDNQGIGRNDVA